MSANFENNAVLRWVVAAGASAAGVLRPTRLEGRIPARPQAAKRRGWASGFVARLANLYFHLAASPTRFFLATDAWQQAEVESFAMLNGPARAHRIGGRSVSADRLPGESFRTLARQGHLTRQAVRAAAREFRRAHHMIHPCTGEPFTHGDATLANMVYDASANRARLIDFETYHTPDVPLPARRADDLAVFILDILSLLPRGEAIGLAMSFLKEYDDPAAWAALPERLRRPRGLGWFYWKVRTNFVAPGEVIERIGKVESLLGQWVQSAALSEGSVAGASAA